jgi:hypothetical protein
VPGNSTAANLQERFAKARHIVQDPQLQRIGGWLLLRALQEREPMKAALLQAMADRR